MGQFRVETGSESELIFLSKCICYVLLGNELHHVARTGHMLLVVFIKNLLPLILLIQLLIQAGNNLHL